MKQVRITLGFLISFYKEVSDASFSPFVNELPETLGRIIEQFQIGEVFTDIDVIQKKIQEYDKLFNIQEEMKPSKYEYDTNVSEAHKKLLRSKSAQQHRGVSQSN